MLLTCFAGCGSSTAEATSSAAGSAEIPAAEETEAAPEETMTEAEPAVETAEASAEDAGPASDAEEAPVEEEETVEYVEYELPVTDGSVTYSYFEGVNPNVSSYISGFEENHFIQEWQARTGISLEITSVHPSSAAENFNIMLAAGDMPDITSSGLSYYTGSRTAAVEEDVFTDLTEYTDYCPNYMAVLNSHDGAVTALSTDEGYIPAFYQIIDGLVSKEGLAIRQDWLDQVDMDVPVTYDDLHDVLTAFKSELGVDAPMMMRSSGAWNNGVFSWGYDINAYMTTNPLVSLPLSVTDGTVRFAMMEDSYEEYIGMLAQWFSEGLIYHDLENITMYAGYTDDILNDSIGYFYTNADMLPTYESGAVSDTFQLTAVASPKINADDEQYFVSAIPYSSTSCWTINAEAEDIETLIQCVDYIYSPEGSILANYGVEGEAYELDADGNPVFTELITNNPDGMSMDAALYIYALQNGALCEDYSRYTSYLSDEEQAMVDVWNQEITESHVYPQKNVSLTTDESETASAILSDVSAYISENVLKFIKGDRSMDEFDAFREELTDMGIEDYIAIYQDAYDRYMQK